MYFFKLSTILFLFLVPYHANAQVLLYSSTDRSSVRSTNVNVNNGTLMGAFTPNTNVTLTNDGETYVGVEWRNNTGFCHSAGSPHMRVFVAATTTEFIGGGGWSTDAIVHTGTGYVFDQMTNTTGSTMQLTAGETYGIYMTANCGAGVNMDWVSGSVGINYYGYLSDGGNGVGLFNQELDTTRIISVVPVDGATVSTSTAVSLSANIYVDPEDFTDDIIVRFNVTRQQNLQLTSVGAVIGTNYDVDVNSSGFSTVSASTSAPLQFGEYLYRVQIINNSPLNRVANFLGFFETLRARGGLALSSTRFIAGAQTGLDVFIDDQEEVLGDIINDPGDFNVNLSLCNPLNFSIRECLTALLIPSSTQLQAIFDQLVDGVLTRVPIGYMWRLGQIISDTATSSMPVISYEFGDGSPLEGLDMSFDFSSTMAQASVIMNEELLSDRDDPQSVMEILMPFWEMFVYFCVFMLVLRDVSGMYTNLGTGGTRET